MAEKILLKEMAERRKEGGEGRKDERTGRKSNRRINCGKILLSLSMINIGKVILVFCFHLKPLFIKKVKGMFCSTVYKSLGAILTCFALHNTTVEKL